MTDFNFTVRATDNAGAYADRNFSLTVNDTATSSVFDRFLVLGSGGLARSQDGVSWSGVDTSFAGSSYTAITYGNNTWVVYAANVSAQFRYANASSMAFTPTGAPTFTNTTTRSVYYFSALIYRKGIWSALMQTYSSGNWSIDEYTSTDLKNFTFARSVTITYSSSTAYPVLGYDYDPVKDVWVALHNNIIWRRQGNGAWTVAGSLSNSSPNFQGGTVLFKNGLWVVANITNTSFATSLDGQNFVTRIGPTNLTCAISYQNGRLVFSPIGTSSGVALNAFESLNGGRTFVARGAARTTYPQTYNLGNYLNRNLVATYAGRTVLLTTGLNSTVYTSNDDLLTTTQNATLTGLATPYSVFARDN